MMLGVGSVHSVGWEGSGLYYECITLIFTMTALTVSCLDIRLRHSCMKVLWLVFDIPNIHVY